VPWAWPRNAGFGDRTAATDRQLERHAIGLRARSGSASLIFIGEPAQRHGEGCNKTQSTRRMTFIVVSREASTAASICLGRADRDWHYLFRGTRPRPLGGQSAFSSRRPVAFAAGKHQTCQHRRGNEPKRAGQGCLPSTISCLSRHPEIVRLRAPGATVCSTFTSSSRLSEDAPSIAMSPSGVLSLYRPG